MLGSDCDVMMTSSLVYIRPNPNPNHAMILFFFSGWLCALGSAICWRKRGGLGG